MTSSGELALAAVTTAAVTVAAASLLARLARRLRLVDEPGARKVQARPVATVGGLAIVAGCAAGAAWSRESSVALALGGVGEGFVLAALLLLAIGLVDDATGKRMGAGAKAAATLAALLVPVIVTGRAEASSWLALLPFAFVALHAMNTVDHANGLAGLVALTSAAAMAVVAGLDPEPGPLGGRGAGEGAGPLLLAAAVGGFLFLNYPRARVYLGDSGTLLLGAWLAGLLFERRQPELLLLAAVPIADLVSVAWLRMRAGVAPWLGDRRHVTHRLVARGVPETKAVLRLAMVQAACSALAGIALVWRWPAAAAWGAVAAVIGTLAIGMLVVAPQHEPQPARASR